MMERKTLIAPLSVKFASSQGTDTASATKTFNGYGAYFGNLDSYGDRIAKGAFTKSIMAHKAAGTNPVMLLNHAMHEMPIGIWYQIAEDESGLFVEGSLIDTTKGRDAYVAMKAGAITGLSIGFFCSAYETHGSERLITEAELLEISVVTIPANDLARVAAVKSKGNTMSDEELKGALKSAGFEDDKVEALFAARNVDENEESKADEAEDDNKEAENASEAKYDEAALMAAIKSIVATTKEIHVR